MRGRRAISQNIILRNGPSAASYSRGTKPPCWRAEGRTGRRQTKEITTILRLPVIVRRKILLEFWFLANSKSLMWSLWEEQKKWKRVNIGGEMTVFRLHRKQKLLFLIDSPMVFFAGISMAGGWTVRNVTFLVSDSTQRSLFFFFPWTNYKQRKKQIGRKGILMNNDTVEEYKRSNGKRCIFKSKVSIGILTIPTNEKERFHHSS